MVLCATVKGAAARSLFNAAFCLETSETSPQSRGRRGSSGFAKGANVPRIVLRRIQTAVLGTVVEKEAKVHVVVLELDSQRSNRQSAVGVLRVKVISDTNGAFRHPHLASDVLISEQQRSRRRNVRHNIAAIHKAKRGHNRTTRRQQSLEPRRTVWVEDTSSAKSVQLNRHLRPSLTNKINHANVGQRGAEAVSGDNKPAVAATEAKGIQGQPIHLVGSTRHCFVKAHVNLDAARGFCKKRHGQMPSNKATLFRTSGQLHLHNATVGHGSVDIGSSLPHDCRVLLGAVVRHHSRRASV